MSDQRLYGLIANLASDGYKLSQELLVATLKTSALTKAWLYRERRAEVMGLSVLIATTQLWAVSGTWGMVIVSFSASFKLVKATQNTQAAQGAILGYQQLVNNGVENYGRQEQANLAPVIRAAKKRASANEDRSGSGQS